MTRFSQLKMQYWRQQQGGLPAGYRRVEYIETNNTTTPQYILTGVFQRDVTEVVTTACDSTPPYSDYDNILLGARYTSSINSAFVIWAGKRYEDTDHRAQAFYLQSSNVNTIMSTIPDYNTTTPHTYRMTRAGLWFDGTQFATFTSSAQISASYKKEMAIFTMNTSSGIDSRKYHGKLYGLRINDSTGLVRNFIPCVRISDSKPGLYDLAGSICPLTSTPFYINSGSGADFTWGELQS